MYLNIKTSSSNIGYNTKSIIYESNENFKYQIKGTYALDKEEITNIEHLSFYLIYKSQNPNIILNKYDKKKIIINDKSIRIDYIDGSWKGSDHIGIEFTNINSKNKINVNLYNFPLYPILTSAHESIRFRLSPKQFVIYHKSKYFIDDTMETIFKHNILKSEYITDLKSGKKIDFESINKAMKMTKEMNLEIIKMSDYYIHMFPIKTYLHDIFKNLDTTNLLNFNTPV